MLSCLQSCLRCNKWFGDVPCRTAPHQIASLDLCLLQVVNHGIPQELVDSMFGASAGCAFPLMPAK